MPAGEPVAREGWVARLGRQGARVIASRAPGMIHRTAIKFCGLTRHPDVAAAIATGVDYIGLVLAKGSPREVAVDVAAQLARSARQADPRVKIVALVRDAPTGFIDTIIAAIAPDLLQFHGSEDEAACAAAGCPYWKAIGMAGGNAVAESARFPTAQALLLDAHGPGAAGGTGHAFDWSRWPILDRPLVLAGGLHRGNVADAIAATRPFAVDVSSGIESSPGIKDHEAMRDFIHAVRAADQRLAGGDPPPAVRPRR